MLYSYRVFPFITMGVSKASILRIGCSNSFLQQHTFLTAGIKTLNNSPLKETGYKYPKVE